MKPFKTIGIMAATVMMGVTGCGPSEQADPAPQTSTSQSVSPDPGEMAGPTENPQGPAATIARVFEEMANQDSVAEATGVLPDISLHEFGARVSVTSIVANESSTQLRFVLSSEATEEQTVALIAFNEAHPLTIDIRDVALEDDGTGIRLLPLLGVPEGETVASGSFCICSDSPKTIDDQGVTLDATFGPLENDTAAVTVVIPGFDPMTEVLVTWQ